MLGEEGYAHENEQPASSVHHGEDSNPQSFTRPGINDTLVSDLQEIMGEAAAESRSSDVGGTAKKIRQRLDFMVKIMRSLLERNAEYIAWLKGAFEFTDFPAAILDLCKQFNLVIQGDTIQLAPGIDLHSFLS
jgi:hypothetical protein